MGSSWSVAAGAGQRVRVASSPPEQGPNPQFLTRPGRGHLHQPAPVAPGCRAGFLPGRHGEELADGAAGDDLSVGIDEPYLDLIEGWRVRASGGLVANDGHDPGVGSTPRGYRRSSRPACSDERSRNDRQGAPVGGLAHRRDVHPALVVLSRPRHSNARLPVRRRRSGSAEDARPGRTVAKWRSTLGCRRCPAAAKTSKYCTLDPRRRVHHRARRRCCSRARRSGGSSPGHGVEAATRRTNASGFRPRSRSASPVAAAGPRAPER